MSITSMMASAAETLENVQQSFLEGPVPHVTIICREKGQTRMILEVIFPTIPDPRRPKISA